LQALWLAGSLFFMRMGSFRHDAIRLAYRPVIVSFSILVEHNPINAIA
jgi:hypothetical protein